MISREDLVEQMYEVSALVPDKDIAGFELGIYAFYVFRSAGLANFRGRPVWADEYDSNEWGVSVVLKEGSRLDGSNEGGSWGPFTD